MYNIVIDRTDEFVYLFNSYTGAFSELTKEVFDEINEKSNIASGIQYFDELREEGFIVPSLLDEYNRIVALEKEAMFSHNTEYVCDVVALTLSCNMNCEYCFEAKRNKNKKIDTEIVPHIIDFMKNQINSNKRIKNFAIQWFGGEPLLGYDYILKICDEIKPLCLEKNIEFESSILTNGLLMTKECASEMIEKCNLKHIQITLDGTEKQYCSIKNVSPQVYYKVLKNIEEISEFAPKISIAIRLNISKKNIDDLKSLCDVLYTKYHLKDKVVVYLAEIKDYTKCFEKDCSVFNLGEYEIVKNDFYKYLNDKYGVYYEGVVSKRNFSPSYCRLVCASNALIGPDGELYKCDQSIGNPNHIIGNVIDGYYYNEAYDKFCSVEHFEKCKTCQAFPLCLSGCKSSKMTFGENAVDCDGLLLSLRNVLKKYY